MSIFRSGFYLLCLVFLTISPLKANDKMILLAVVNTPDQSGLMAFLLQDFETISSYRVALYGGEDVFDRAQRGQADLLIAHFGKAAFEDFVRNGLGRWPQMVFANQQVLIGPSADPAGIEGMTSAAAALKQIADKQQPDLKIQVSVDPLLQRVMAISLVNPENHKDLNAAGARALRDYLLSAPVQARVSQFRQSGYNGQLCWPAARHN